MADDQNTSADAFFSGVDSHLEDDFERGERRLFSIDLSAVELDQCSMLLIDHIRTNLMIQSELFLRIFNGASTPSALLAELLEDAGNRYLDFAEALESIAHGRLNNNVWPSL